MKKSIVFFESLCFDPEGISSSCKYCGQNSVSAIALCPMCEKQQIGIVLAVLRQLVLSQGKVKQTQSDDTETKDNSKVKEMLVASSLDEFPFELIRRLRKFPHFVKTSGVWFAHLCAYCNANHIHGGDGATVLDVVQSPTYTVLRDTMFDLMRNDGPEIDEDVTDTVSSLYRIEEASLDPRNIIYEMMIALEEKGMLQIERLQVECLACGADVPIGVEYCEDCRKDQKLAVMKAMQGNKPPPLISSSQPKRSGMHIHKE